MGSSANVTPQAEDKAREERRKQLRVLYERVKARSTRSRLELTGKDPNFAYYYGNINPDEMAKYAVLGFEVDKDPKVCGSLPRAADGTLRMGDAILLHMPKDEYDLLLEINRVESQDQIDAAIDKLTAEATRLKVPIFETEKKQ